MPLPSDLLARPTLEAVRRIVLERLAALEAPAARLAQADDDEALHDVRVALRRLRSALRAYRPFLEDSVRVRDRRSLARLQARTGDGRDAEACLERLAELGEGLSASAERGRRWFAERLVAAARKGRREAHARLARWLERRGARLARRLSQYAVSLDGAPLDGDDRAALAPFAASVARLVREHATAFTEGLERLADPAHADEAHGVRIAGKRLRYLIEPLAGLLAGAETTLKLLRQAQQDLGALQDFDVLERALGAALEESAVAHARRLHAQANADPAPQRERTRDAARAGLLALIQAVKRARPLRWENLRRTWCAGDRLQALRAGLEGLAHGAQAQSGVEIERKYLLSALPAPLPAGDALEVEQGWLPGDVLQERFRRVRRGAEVACWRTLKLGRGVMRTEWEERIDESLFARLWPLTEGLRVRKRRHVIADGSHTWEIDEFLDRDLVLAEVELSDPAQPIAFPAWLAPCVVREVTDEDAFVNRRLAH